MSADEHTPEDIAGLFGKFGGDAHGYREFAPPEGEAEAPRVWPLLSGEKIAHPPAAPVPVQAPPAAPAQAPAFARAPAPAPVYAPAPAPAPAPFLAPAAAPQSRIEPVLRSPAPAALAPAPAFAPPPVLAPAPAFAAVVPVGAQSAADNAGAPPTPLEQLFARLASPQPPAAAPGPMSRWRRPT